MQEEYGNGETEVEASMLMLRCLRSLCTAREHSWLCRALLHQPPAASANGELAIPRMRTSAALLTLHIQMI